MHLKKLFIALLVSANVGCPAPGPSSDPAAPGGNGNYRSGNDVTEGSTTIDARDIASAADAVVRGILSQPGVAATGQPPILIIDAQHWVNESTAVFNLNMLGDDISTAVVEKAGGRVQVIDEEATAIVEHDRTLVNDGTVGQGTIDQGEVVAGHDYRLLLRITSMDAVHKGTGTVDRAFQLAFKLVNKKRMMVWTKSVKVRKSGTDDVVYQ